VPGLPRLPPLPAEAKQPWLLHLGSTLPHKASSDAVRWTARHLQAAGASLQMVVAGALDAETAGILEAMGGRLVDTVLTGVQTS
jgi:hypothetical protein